MKTRIKQANKFFNAKEYLKAYELYEQELSDITRDVKSDHSLKTRSLECLIETHLIDLEKARDEFSNLELSLPEKNADFTRLDNKFKVLNHENRSAKYHYEYGVVVNNVITNQKRMHSL